jgi:hypothetical protein
MLERFCESFLDVSPIFGSQGDLFENIFQAALSIYMGKTIYSVSLYQKLSANFIAGVTNEILKFSVVSCTEYLIKSFGRHSHLSNQRYLFSNELIVGDLFSNYLDGITVLCKYKDTCHHSGSPMEILYTALEDFKNKWSVTYLWIINQIEPDLIESFSNSLMYSSHLIP